MRNTSTWAVLALLGLTGSCSPREEAPPLSAQSAAIGTSLPLASRVKDLNPGAGDGLPERLKPHFYLHGLGSTLFLRADDGVNGPALWRSNGTESGTRLVKDFTADGSENLGDEPAVLGDALYFFAHDADGLGLWKMQESAEQPVLVHALGPRGQGPTHSLRRLGNRLSFVHTAADTGTEPWVTDGTEAGTRLAADVRPGTASSEPQYLRDLDGALFFTADDGVHGRELWRSDASADTRLVKDLNAEGDAFRYFEGSLRTMGNAVYFFANAGPGAQGLWRSDGSDAGTVLVKAFELGWADELVSTGARIFFTVTPSGSSARQLWRTDGTPESTVLLLDDASGGVSGGLLAQGDHLFFVGPGSSGGTALWLSDGTPGGTVRLKDVAVHGDNFYGYGLFGALLVFRGDDGVHGKELWRSDGTPEGTFMVADVREGPESSDASHFALVAGTLYFRATDGVSGYELWSIPMAKVDDPFAPSVTCPANLEVTAPTPVGVAVSYPAAQASDNSGVMPTVSYSQSSGSIFPPGITDVEVTAADAAANEAYCSFRVTVTLSAADAGAADAGALDGGLTELPDAGAAEDAGVVDAGVAEDAGTPDAGTPDAGLPDTSVPDAGNTAAGGEGGVPGGAVSPPGDAGCATSGAQGGAWLAVFSVLAYARRSRGVPRALTR